MKTILATKEMRERARCPATPAAILAQDILRSISQDRYWLLYDALIVRGVPEDPWDLVRRHAECPFCGAKLDEPCSNRSTPGVPSACTVHLARLRVFLRFCLSRLIEQVSDEQALQTWQRYWVEGAPRDQHLVVLGLNARPSLIPRLALLLPADQVDPLLRAIDPPPPPPGQEVSK